MPQYSERRRSLPPSARRSALQVRTVRPALFASALHRRGAGDRGRGRVEWRIHPHMMFEEPKTEQSRRFTSRAFDQGGPPRFPFVLAGVGGAQTAAYW
ncbi:MAG TPA: hypothetical protein VI094_13925 [Propionibacteriaceae bacterium]